MSASPPAVVVMQSPDARLRWQRFLNHLPIPLHERLERTVPGTEFLEGNIHQRRLHRPRRRVHVASVRIDEQQPGSNLAARPATVDFPAPGMPVTITQLRASGVMATDAFKRAAWWQPNSGDESIGRGNDIDHGNGDVVAASGGHGLCKQLLGGGTGLRHLQQDCNDLMVVKLVDKAVGTQEDTVAGVDGQDRRVGFKIRAHAQDSG